MAFVKTKDQMQNRVGNSYGERRTAMQNPASSVNAQRPAVQKSQDKFSNSTTTNRNIDVFSSNASFRTSAAIHAPGIPYKKPVHEHLERGTAPADTGKKPPSDQTILNFLDKVIASAPAKSQLRSNVSLNSRALNKVKSNPQKTNVAVRPALPRTSRPIPTLSKTATNKA